MTGFDPNRDLACAGGADMKRTINSTGRRRFAHPLVTVRLTEPAGGLPRSFTAHFGDLADAGFPPEARIYVEPYVASSSVTFAFGTVAPLRRRRTRN